MSRSIKAYNPNTCDCCGCPDFETEVETRVLEGLPYGFIGLLAVTDPDIPNFYRTYSGRGWSRDPGSIAKSDYLCKIRSYADQTLLGFNQGKVWSIGCWEEATQYSLPPYSVGACAPTLLTTCAEGPGHLLQEEITDQLAIFPEYGGGGPNPPGGGEIRLLDQVPLPQLFAEITEKLRATAFATTASHPAQAVGWRVEREEAESGRMVYLYLKQTRFRFRFKVPGSGGYRVTWILEYDPLRMNIGGGISDPAFVVDTSPPTGNEAYEEEQSWQWDGTVPPGYDEGDDSTWPVSPWLELPEAPPGFSGRFRIKHITDVFYDVESECLAPGTPETFSSGGAAYNS